MHPIATTMDNNNAPSKDKDASAAGERENKKRSAFAGIANPPTSLTTIAKKSKSCSVSTSSPSSFSTSSVSRSNGGEAPPSSSSSSSSSSTTTSSSNNVATISGVQLPKRTMKLSRDSNFDGTKGLHNMPDIIAKVN